ncbi:DUF3048 domain-containing protein [Halobacillus locisalis]|uniref:DUF3048 domain-containing protein n=1 Tax=Halobacillus locisalis TaxID=220753 RepID=A0A838CW22_9BACI|nr:DUF3048 domain-containing protein [Halobacillus locisalis]MBA2175955.1 DUF3048 domain-containing protein [Halobacillus locisalis]
MRKLASFSLLLVLLLLAACSGEAGASQESKADQTEPPERSETSEQPEKEKEVDVVVEEEPEEEEVTFDNVYPLTGEPTNEEVDHRVVSVMVNNHTKARPQSGLSQADVVYEVLAEGQITRFLALYHSELPEMIGPVRSARPYYMELAAGFDALYTYHGASTNINRHIAGSGIDYLDGAAYDRNGWLFERSSERRPPHDSYFLTNGIDRAVEQQGYAAETTTPSLPFKEDITPQGTRADDVQVTYYDREGVSYSYDESSGQYLRSSDGEKSFDEANGERIALDNVFIVRTGHSIIDNVGRRDVDLTSGGEAYLLQKGMIQEIQWKSVDGRILPYKDGQPLSFTPGQTWVNIIQGSTRVDVTN